MAGGSAGHGHCEVTIKEEKPKVVTLTCKGKKRDGKACREKFTVQAGSDRAQDERCAICHDDSLRLTAEEYAARKAEKMPSVLERRARNVT
mgnify:CR=1 FL=1